MATDRTAIRIDDLYQLGWLETPRFSPDGRYIAFVRVRPDRVHNRYRREIWLAPTDGQPARRFTSGEKGDSAPCWSPDSRRLVFVSSRVEPAQLYVIDVGGGEAQQLTNLPNGASDPAWSGDGQRIAFLSRVNEAERISEDSGTATPVFADVWERDRAKAQRDHEEMQRFDPRVVTQIPYRSGTTFFDDRRNHIYVIDVVHAIEEIPRPYRVTDGDFHFRAPVWMPDGQSILTTATRDAEADAVFTYYDVFRVPVLRSGRGVPQRLTEPGFSFYDPCPSPDGALIALRHMPEDRPLAVGTRIALLSSQGGALRDLTSDTDLNVVQHRWLAGGDGLVYTAGWWGTQALYSVMRDGSLLAPTHIIAQSAPHERAQVGDGRMVGDFDVGPDNSVAFVASGPDYPSDLFLRLPTGAEIRLTQINARLLDQRFIAPCEEVRFTAPDDQEVQGWLLRPPGYDPTARYPLAVYIHGGPHLMWGAGFQSMWHEWQAAAARGYVVFFCNPRGSDGYGECWRDGIHAHWGIADAPDIHAGIDAVIARGGVDPQRIAVTGGSYGGFMTVWLLGHSDRFVCAVAARGVYNLLSQYSTSDAHKLIEYEFDGYPWEMPERLWRHSPLAYVDQIKTPLRILHGELDYRVPMSEAEQLFAFLQRRKQVVELVRYPREGHELTRTGEPRHRADHMERTLAWFDRYCLPQVGTGAEV